MITFTVRSDAELRAKPAVVTARQLAAFRAFLQGFPAPPRARKTTPSISTHG